MVRKRARLLPQRVRFAESVVTHVYHPQQWNQDECCPDDLWWSANDLAIFAETAHANVLDLQADIMENPHAPWHDLLLQSYQDLDLPLMEQQVQEIVTQQPCTFLLPALGLERKVLLREEKAAHMRQQLYTYVKVCQREVRASNEAQMRRRMRQASRNVSVPAALWARHLAQLVAADHGNSDNDDGHDDAKP